MTDTEVFICLVILAITVIPTSFWCVFTISKEIDMDIERCELMKRWAKKNLERKDGDHHDSN